MVEAPLRVIAKVLGYVPRIELCNFIHEEWARHIFLKRALELCVQNKGIYIL